VIILATLPPIGMVLFNTVKCRQNLPQKIKDVNTALLILFGGFVVSGVINIILYLTLLLNPNTSNIITNIKNMTVHLVYLVSFWVFYFVDRKISKGGDDNDE
jgi:hypothetical protein